ncbi:MAG: low molecular weight protein-tyrosine-phosphatase [Povalibacter sp.]|jgi:protein-tyrosine phosphatase
MRILFVCMGNICRSPTAEGVFRQLLAARGIESILEVDSAGTHDYHVGEAPDTRAVEAAKRRGIDLSNLRARQIAEDDFARFDLILAMDEQNLAELKSRAGHEYLERVRLVMDYAPSAARRFVPDPYYGGPLGFEEVLDLLEQASEGLVENLLNTTKVSR